VSELGKIIIPKVGLVPDGKLVELLELAFSADDVVGTVRCTRELVDSGIEPTSLLSQLAGLITDLLAGDCTSHGFFGRSMCKKIDAFFGDFDSSSLEKSGCYHVQKYNLH
jgi:DNA polymerase III gamma/tau subunit